MRGACACTQGRSVLRSEYGCTGLSCKICLICTQREVHEHTPHYIHIVLLCITVSIMVNAFLNNGTVVQGAAVLKAVHKCRGNKCNFGAGSEEVDVAAVGRGLDGLDRVDSEDKEDDEVSKPAAVRCAGAGAGAVRHRRGSGPGRKRKRIASSSSSSSEEEEDPEGAEKLSSSSPSEEEEEEAEEEEEGGAQFEVEEIVDHRRRNGKLQYKIKWKGYASKYNSWEGKSGIDAPDALAAYKKTKIGSALKGD